ncbi:putative U1 SNP-associating protein 1 (Usa1) [Monocercomonoides exilis]|uniref:putative U1 SNP-associating protein 1 (Usa1) n=1 Tax=Monocercomonoides exilis TaxID=2049356 RepID=UPI003559E7DC|nr:putative U1 SNP-associating protein 1 (Usa1) [Monocercomonoides exilis]|eukprot:MONOS_990.1-p1 / transcript=MONOS_990.1 / gene=MONOS_990 / organism=Monocercomonoides_exilis_PA203 / gene_product=U1 SNP-associating protein 1 (Usa1) / transcript_product=U1 SNP-associating protein 1 (Usa1) / location=Mono_scaffold00016:192432-195088(-) / protein_length=774 / sequence_SO=supercontig / SO=protein_coding / is_pseudo=false
MSPQLTVSYGPKKTKIEVMYSTKMQDVLEQSCAKLAVGTTNCLLLHKGKPVDLTDPFRLSGLPSNAILEIKLRQKPAVQASPLPKIAKEQEIPKGDNPFADIQMCNEPFSFQSAFRKEAEEEQSPKEQAPTNKKDDWDWEIGRGQREQRERSILEEQRKLESEKEKERLKRVQQSRGLDYDDEEDADIDSLNRRTAEGLLDDVLDENEKERIFQAVKARLKEQKAAMESERSSAMNNSEKIKEDQDNEDLDDKYFRPFVLSLTEQGKVVEKDIKEGDGVLDLLMSQRSGKQSSGAGISSSRQLMEEKRKADELRKQLEAAHEIKKEMNAGIPVGSSLAASGSAALRSTPPNEASLLRLQLANSSDHGRRINMAPKRSAAELSASLEKLVSSVPDEVFQPSNKELKSYIQRIRGTQGPQILKMQQPSAAQPMPVLSSGDDVTMLRVVFPDGASIEGLFVASVHTIGDVITWIKEVLNEPELPFFITSAPPPRRHMDLTQTLLSEGLTPSAVLRLNCEESVAQQFLDEEKAAKAKKNEMDGTEEKEESEEEEEEEDTKEMEKDEKKEKEEKKEEEEKDMVGSEKMDVEEPPKEIEPSKDSEQNDSTQQSEGQSGKMDVEPEESESKKESTSKSPVFSKNEFASSSKKKKKKNVLSLFLKRLRLHPRFLKKAESIDEALDASQLIKSMDSNPQSSSGKSSGKKKAGANFNNNSWTKSGGQSLGGTNQSSPNKQQKQSGKSGWGGQMLTQSSTTPSISNSDQQKLREARLRAFLTKK